MGRTPFSRAIRAVSPLFALLLLCALAVFLAAGAAVFAFLL